MIDCRRNDPYSTLKETGDRVVRSGAVDLVLGAAAGAVFGVVFGTFGSIVHFNIASVHSIAAYFAMCGAAAGALVGVWGGLIDDANAWESAIPPVKFWTAWRSAGADRDSAVARPSQSEIRLVSDLSTARRPREVAASHSPSWN